MDRLREVFQRLRQANLKLKPKKCSLFKQSVNYLGHVISRDGVSTDPEKVRAVEEWPVPQSTKDVRSFIGLASYYRRYIHGFAKIAQPLHRLMVKNRIFQWTDECEMAFQMLKRSQTTAPIIAYPKEIREFILDMTQVTLVLEQSSPKGRTGRKGHCVCQPHDVKTRKKLLCNQKGTVSGCHECKVLPSLISMPEIRDPH